MFLGIFVLFDGLNIILLKFSSVVLYLGTIAGFYAVFRDKLDAVVLDVTLLLMAMNFVTLELSHHLYSEMLYTVVQIGALYYFWKAEGEQWSLKSILFLALAGMVGFYVRSLGGTFPLAVALWLILQRNWKALAWFGASSALFYLPLKLTEFAYGVTVVGQAPQILMVSPYNPSLGNETFSGIVLRFINNVVVYVQYLFPKSLGLPSWDHLGATEVSFLPDGKAFVSVLLSLVVIIGLVRMFRQKSSLIPFAAFYTAVYILFLCFSLQNVFTTARYLIPVVPFLIVSFVVGMEVLIHRVLRTQLNKTPGFKRLFVLGTFALIVSNAAVASKAVNENLPILKANIKGEEFAGYSVDWINYLKACRWIGQNLQRDSVSVICRKPELFQIYTQGYLTHGVYQIESTNPDTIIANWKRWKMTHLLYDNFQWTGTLRRYIQPVAEKYPALFVLLHKEGIDAPSLIYRLQYAAIPSR